jgi:SRSO17 transposase
MKHHQHITLVEANTTPTQVVQWAQALTHLHARIAARFARPEPRQRALKYLQGILSSIERKNGWQLAEHAREARPDGMQRLLSNAVWDTDGVRDDLRTYTLEHLGNQSAIVAIDAHKFSQTGQEVGRRRGAVLRKHRTGRELSGGRLSLVCHSQRAYAH